VAYIGNDLQVAFSTYKNIDDISGSFDGVTTSFALLVNGVAPAPLPLNSNQCLISVGGVVQRPDDTGTEGFRLSGGNIVFSSAPNTAEDFFGVILAGADYVNAGANFPDGTLAAPSITFDQDNDTGYYRSGSGAVSFASNGVAAGTWSSAGVTAPALIPTGSSVPANGVYLPAANTVGVATNGVERVEFGTGEVVFNDGGANYDFRIEGDTNTSLFFVDASAEAVGIGTASPQSKASFLTTSVPASSPTWSNSWVSVGPNVGSSTGAALGLGYDSSGDEAYLVSVAPGVAFKPLNIQANIIKFQAGSSGEDARIDTSGRLLIGTSTARSNFNNTTDTTRLQIEGTDAATSSLSLVCNNGGGVPVASIHLAKSASGSIGSTTAVSNNWDLGDIRFSGSDGTEFVQAASIACEVDGTPGANDMPGRLVFSTTADGASSPTERMRIDNLGYIFSVPTYNNSSAFASNMGVLSNGIFYRSTSSIKYKTEVEDIDYAYSNALLKCRPVWYRSTCKADPTKHGYWGFIAEEVAKIDPRLVHWKTVEITYDDKGATVETPLETPEPEGVQYDRFVPHLLNLIKRQGEAITDLQAEVAALKAK
jgi:hypothetical protein